jgi:hypothetical protein
VLCVLGQADGSVDLEAEGSDSENEEEDDEEEDEGSEASESNSETPEAARERLKTQVGAAVIVARVPCAPSSIRVCSSDGLSGG